MATRRTFEEVKFSAMGTTAHVLVTEPAPHFGVDWAQERVARLEARWSRFDPESEVSRLNASSGMPMPVSSDTTLLLQRASAACELTNGRFNPFVGNAIAHLGYDTTFTQIATRELDRLSEARDPQPVPPATVTINHEANVVSYSPQVSFDPGGIGKGLAADLVVEELIASGAGGALVSLGGDLRVAGQPPSHITWNIEVNEPGVDGAGGHVIALTAGAVATSTNARRTWLAGGTQHHHIIDATTGASAASNISLVTVVAGAGWWAEAAATAIMCGQVADHMPPNLSALIVDSTGAVHVHGQMKDHLAPRRSPEGVAS